MNIFVLDRDPVVAARYACDKHVVKMVLETAQILCSALFLNNDNIPIQYKPTHVKHPCVLWAAKSIENFRWLVYHGLGLADEYNFRYKKIHKSSNVILDCGNLDYIIPAGGLTEFEQCMPKPYIDSDPVIGYHNYYNNDKAKFAKWTLRDVPYWFKPCQ